MKSGSRPLPIARTPSNEADELEWRHIQAFGDDASGDEDLVTTVAFDETGNYLAVGDKAGRVCIFQETERSCQSFKQAGAGGEDGDDGKDQRSQAFSPIEYKFYMEFQSHDAELDSLKNVSIDERISMIQWGKATNNAQFILSTNDRSIKLWKVHDRIYRRPIRGPSPAPGTYGELVLPKLSKSAPAPTATRKRVFTGAHSCPINSISLNSDGATFLSADECYIHIWSLDDVTECYNVVDIQPTNLEEITEIITMATWHPTACSQFLYASTRGSIRVVDLRDSALADQSQHARIFELEEDPSTRSFFSDITSSVYDAQFTPDGRYIIARDYLTVKVWDVNMESKPVATVPVHDYLQRHLCDLYENDCIFDRFHCAASPDGSQFVTGSYHNYFMVHNLLTQNSITIEAPRHGMRRKPRQNKSLRRTGARKERKQDTPDVNLMDFNKKALLCSWHPRLDCLAIAGGNKLYVYQGFPPSKDTAA